LTPSSSCDAGPSGDGSPASAREAPLNPGLAGSPSASGDALADTTASTPSDTTAEDLSSAEPVAQPCSDDAVPAPGDTSGLWSPPTPEI
jgi:hypothetical protein